LSHDIEEIRSYISYQKHQQEIGQNITKQPLREYKTCWSDERISRFCPFAQFSIVLYCVVIFCCLYRFRALSELLSRHKCIKWTSFGLLITKHSTMSLILVLQNRPIRMLYLLGVTFWSNVLLVWAQKCTQTFYDHEVWKHLYILGSCHGIGGTIYGDNMGACKYINILKNRMLETSVHCEHIRVICSHWPFERSR